MAPRPRVVCDNDRGLTNAVRARFPEAELYLFEWHLCHTLERLMAISAPRICFRDAIDELLPDVEAVFMGPLFETPFLERAHATGHPAPERVAEHHRADRRGAVPPARNGLQPAADVPLSTSPLDAFINPIRVSIQPRAYGLKKPLAHQPNAGAHAATRQPPRQRSRLHAFEPRVAESDHGWASLLVKYRLPWCTRNPAGPDQGRGRGPRRGRPRSRILSGCDCGGSLTRRPKNIDRVPARCQSAAKPRMPCACARRTSRSTSSASSGSSARAVRPRRRGTCERCRGCAGSNGPVR